MSDIPFTGSEQQADTTITISISEVREINKKLIERKYLKEIVAHQDTIISTQAEYINEQKRIVEEAESALEREKFLHNMIYKKSNILKGTAIALSAALAISLLFNFIK